MQVRTSSLNLVFRPRTNNTAADHPHGGGRGKSKGNVDPVSPWGMPVSHCDSSPSIAKTVQAKGGYKTRKVRKPNKWVITARERNHGKRRVK